MPEFGTYTGLAAAAPPPPPAPAVAPLLYELRPLSIGEILDRTFSLYRQRFWLYVGLSSLAAAITTAGTFVQLTFGPMAHLGTPAATQPAIAGRAAIISGISSIVTVLVYLLAYSLTQAATVSAVKAAYLGEETSIGKSLQTVKRYWYRYILIVFWQSWSMMWLPMVLFIPALMLMALNIAAIRWMGILFAVLAALSLIYAPFAYIRNALGVVASVAEKLKVRASMRRSKVLVAGHKARVLAIILLIWVLSFAAGVIQEIFVLFMAASHTWVRVLLEVLSLVATFATGSVVAPVGAIAFCILYIDERIRKEGFDVETLMERAMAQSPAMVRPADRLESPFTTEIV